MSNLLARARAQPPSEDPAVLGPGGGVRDRRWGTGNGEPRSWNRRSTRRHTEAFRYPVPITTTRSEPAGRFHNHDRTAASRPTSREPTHAVLPGRHGHRRVPRGASARSSACGPEDWVASTATVFRHSTEGLTRLPDGRWLRDAVQAAPIGWLGRRHVDAHGTSTALLVKLLDAGQRLPVHFHPD